MSRSNARRVLRMSEMPSNGEIKQVDHVITTLFRHSIIFFSAVKECHYFTTPLLGLIRTK
jgi:hypothetical protein